MSTFLLVVTFMLSNGQKGVALAQFPTQRECFSAMQAVNQDAQNVSMSCKEITRQMQAGEE